MNSESQIRVLVAEDEDHLRAVLEQFLVGRGYAVTVCETGKAALEALQGGSFHVAVIDLAMPEMDGLEILRHLRSDRDAPEVIMITNPSTVDTAISAIKLGAYDYIAKPLRMAEVDVLVRRAWEKRELVRANSLLRNRVPSVTSITSHHSGMVATVDQAAAIAASDDVIVIHGEIGAGKNHMARYIHSRSGRASDMFVEVTSRAGIGDIFQYLCGTDSVPSRGRYRAPVSGIFQIAENGTVVLDADIFSADEVERFVSIARDRVFSREGGSSKVPLRSRLIVCARDSDDWTSTIPAVHLTVPPLRERPNDVPDIAKTILMSMDGGADTKVISEDVFPLLQSYSWPGNVRELEAILTRVVLLSHRSEISVPDLKMILIWESMSSVDGGAALEDVERLYIETVLQRSNWHQGRAAELLGISTKTLYRKMREYGFVRPRKRKLARGNRAE